jgi:hypothetical protein
LTLAKKLHAAVRTIDYNLNKVAVVEGIIVLNVNELAQSLRMAYLPGEKMLLELVQKGQDAHQAVGYLTDGTMVVVENASKSIGQTVEIEFIRSLQTAAGKMMFAKPVERKQEPKQQQKPHGKKQVQAPKPAQQKAVPAATPPVTTTAYHSDQNDRRLAATKQQPATEAIAVGDQPAKAKRHRVRRKPTPKPRTSAQREASLLELVNKQ